MAVYRNVTITLQGLTAYQRLVANTRMLLDPDGVRRILQRGIRNACMLASRRLGEELQEVGTRGHSVLGYNTYVSFSKATAFSVKFNRNVGIIASVGLKKTEHPTTQPWNRSRRIIRPWKYWHMVNVGTQPHWQRFPPVPFGTRTSFNPTRALSGASSGGGSGRLGSTINRVLAAFGFGTSSRQPRMWKHPGAVPVPLLEIIIDRNMDRIHRSVERFVLRAFREGRRVR